MGTDSKQCKSTKISIVLLPIWIILVICYFSLDFKIRPFSSSFINLTDFVCDQNVTWIKFRKIWNLPIDADFAIVYQDNVHISRVENFELCPLIKLLLKHPDLLTISMQPDQLKPVCSLIRDNFTLTMAHKFGEFTSGDKRLSDSTLGTCYACDLLPDIFLLKINAEFRKILRDIENYTLLENSLHVPFSLALKGRSAYCPKIHQFKLKITEDVSCNNLHSRWDNQFYLVPKLTNIYRLITPDNRETWLGCMWWKKAYQLNLPIHCSNFVRQYLFDVVDIFENYSIDYRLLFGTVLGALRNQDIIPWTADSDIFPVMNDSKFDNFRISFLAKIYEISKKRYTNLSWRNLDEYPPGRVFPACPVLLTSRKGDIYQVNNQTRNELIERILNDNTGLVSTDHGDVYFTFGYVDIFRYNHLSKCLEKSDLKRYEIITIANRSFKTFTNITQAIMCEYGDKNVLTNVPRKSLADWKSFIISNS